MLGIITFSKRLKIKLFLTPSFAALALSFSLLLQLAPGKVYALETSESTYYLVDENQLFNNNFQSPQFVAKALNSDLGQKAINLLKWAFFRTNPVSYEDYSRTRHFGQWINDPNDETCYNTRAKVLMRDSKRQVTYRGARNCTVNTGQWNDPYSGQRLTLASDIQIDHMVPLKHAYTHGAWSWNFYYRCLYANYVGNSIHLLSVRGHENMSKGDRSPEEWLPPNQAYRCEYVRNWLLIKLIWRLRISENEIKTVQKVISYYRCPTHEYVFMLKELVQQRKTIQDNLGLCAHLKPRN